MKNCFIIPLILFFSAPLWAQYANVSFDYEKSFFNDNQPLPSERYMMFSGTIPQNILAVELSILSSKGKTDRTPMYTAIWKRPFEKQSDVFTLPVNYKLKASSKYDLQLAYYEGISESEKNMLKKQIMANLETYLDNSLAQKDNQVFKKSKILMHGMDRLIADEMLIYRPQMNIPYKGFSDLVKQKIEKIQDTTLKNSTSGANEASRKEQKANFQKVNQTRKAELIADLLDRLSVEVDRMLQGDWSKLKDTRYVDNYETESKKGSFAINAGYGGTYLSGKLEDNFTYGTAPYLGLSFPLGNSAFAPKILRNGGIIFGVYTKNFTDENENEVTGPIFKRPVFVGLDYRLFQFVRFNAGASVLEGLKAVEGQSSNNMTSHVYIRPFVGVSAKINLSISLDN